MAKNGNNGRNINKRRRRSSAGSSLPPWATVDMVGKQRPQDVNVEQEELVFRQATFRKNVQQPLEVAHAQAWEDVFSKLWQSDLRTLFEGQNEQNSSPTSTKNTASNSHLTIQPSYQYREASLLPLAIFCSPPAVADRQMMVRCFLRYWSTVNNRTLTIHLPSLRSSVQGSLELLVHQCLDQEREQPLSRFLRRKCQSIPSYTELFVLWASHTRSFSSILICLEDSGDYSTQHVKQDFIACLKDIRSNYRIPIGLVLSVNRQQLDWSQSIVNMESSFVVKNFQVSSSEVARFFWKHYCAAADNHTIPPSWILQVLGRDFWNHHRSVSELVQQFHILSVEQYTERGAWLGAAAKDGDFPQLTAWFSTYISSKEFLSTATGEAKLKSILLLDSIQRSRQKVLGCLNLLDETQLSACPLFEHGTVNGSISPNTIHVLDTLHEIRRRVQGDSNNGRKDSGDSSGAFKAITKYLASQGEDLPVLQQEDVVKEALLDEINELIVLVAAGLASTASMEQISIDSNSNIALYELAKKMWHLFDDLTRKAEDENILLPKAAGDCWELRLKSINRESRSGILAALNHAPPRLEDGKYSAKILHKILLENSNNTIGRDDLFRKFALVVDETGKANNTILVKRFVAGVWFLFQLGLMNIGRSQKKGGFSYEKATASWNG